MGMGLYRILTLAACCAALGFAATSCKDSQDSAADRKSRNSVDQAGRVLRGTEQTLLMTDSELDKAADATSQGQRQRLADQIKARRDQAINIQQFDKTIDELLYLQKQYEKTNEIELLQDISSKALQAGQWLAASDVTMNAEAQTHNQQKIQNAQKRLQDALTQAELAGNDNAKVGPYLTQGTIELLKYQAALKNYKHQEVAIRSLQTTLAKRHTEIVRWEIFEGQRESEKPDETVRQLKQLLDQPTHGLRDRMAAAEKKIAEIQSRKLQVRNQYDTCLSKANEQEKEYFALKLEAEKHSGNKRYELLDKAFALRAGQREGTDRIEGSIYYEAQAEVAKSQLEIIQFNLEYEQLQKDLIARSIRQVSDSLTKLQDPELAQTLRDDIAQAQQNRNIVLEQILLQLAEIRKEETIYKTLREAPVAALEQAQRAFTQAGYAARQTGRKQGQTRLSNTADFAEKLKESTINELANFWRQTARHYQIGAELLGILGDINELQTSVQAILNQYERNAEQAEKTADTLTPKTPE